MDIDLDQTIKPLQQKKFIIFDGIIIVMGSVFDPNDMFDKHRKKNSMNR